MAGINGEKTNLIFILFCERLKLSMPNPATGSPVTPDINHSKVASTNFIFIVLSIQFNHFCTPLSFETGI